MPPVIDSHAHVFPDRFQKIAPSASRGPVDRLRKRARGLMKPVSMTIHRTRTWLRILPSQMRKPLEQLGSIAPMASLLVESTLPDLNEAMTEAGVDYAAVIAQPPWIPNEYVLDVAADNPQILPIVNLAPGTENPGEALRNFAKRGACALKIHPAADGEGPDSPRYWILLRAAADLNLPVIIHTGCLHVPFVFKDPNLSRAERFTPWFKEFPNLRFILAHMNFHEPDVALDLAERFRNLYVETSWQPTEVVGEAARRLGASRVLFGSDWPFVGGNLSVGIDRVRDCIETGTLAPEDADAILGGNAAKLFGIEGDHAP